MFFNSDPKQPLAFDIAPLEQLALNAKDDYASATPFKHAVFDEFLPIEYANCLLKYFPDQHSSIWKAWGDPDRINHPNKQAIWNAANLNGLQPYFLNIISAFNSYPFLNFLSKLTGIKKLLPDPYLYGGGPHQILNSGRLAIHTDFNNHAALDLYRRINVLFYLNKNWRDEYNGHLELWDVDLKDCVKSISPIFNRLVIFNTDKQSFHGHPKPLNTPPDITRKSLAFYYYTALPNADGSYDEDTDWKDVGAEGIQF